MEESVEGNFSGRVRLTPLKKSLDEVLVEWKGRSGEEGGRTRWMMDIRNGLKRIGVWRGVFKPCAIISTNSVSPLTKLKANRITHDDPSTHDHESPSYSLEKRQVSALRKKTK